MYVYYCRTYEKAVSGSLEGLGESIEREYSSIYMFITVGPMKKL